jgi:CubicO group peptidase (beta-lactamase class C family)
MKAKQLLIVCLVVLGVLGLVKLGTLVWLFTAGLRTPARVESPDYWPTDGWQTSTPEEQGFDSAKMAEGLQALQENLVNIDSLLIVRNGYVVLDAHFAPYDGTFPHDMASVTKSVMTTLIAIAVEQGKLDLDQPVISFFPERTIANLDERKQQLTIRHLASMRNGMESGCFDADEPTLDSMRATSDWVQAALDRPMVLEPGTEFCYDSVGMHLLSAILQVATGMTAFEFAQQNLFEPLGIQDVLWESDPQGYSRGWGDLHLLPEDLAKIGFLWLHRGQWDGQQIVSEAWVLDSVRAHSKFIGPDFGYGYGWWVAWGDYQAAGRGGQKVRVVSSLNTLIVTTGGNFDYADVEQWIVPMLLQAKTSRPANPEGVAALEAVLVDILQESAQWTAGYTPDTAGAVSGKVYLCEGNPANIETIRMDFDGSDQATLFATIGGVDWVWSIGLDGRYRLAPDWTGFRGYWENAQTFQFEGFDIGLLNRTVVFDGDGMQISLPEAGLTIACRVQNP